MIILRAVYSRKAASSTRVSGQAAKPASIARFPYGLSLTGFLILIESGTPA
jgi:hypothetical protein